MLCDPFLKTERRLHPIPLVLDGTGEREAAQGYPGPGRQAGRPGGGPSYVAERASAVPFLRTGV